MEIGVSSCLQACRIRGLQCLSGPGIGWACIGFVSHGLYCLNQRWCRIIAYTTLVEGFKGIQGSHG
jgi:hypothetical protein